MINKKVLIAALLAGGIVAVGACQKKPAFSDEMATYSSNKSGITLAYPQNWHYSGKAEGGKDSFPYLLFQPESDDTNPLQPKVFFELINGLNRDNSKIGLDEIAKAAIEQVKQKKAHVDVKVADDKVKINNLEFVHYQLLIKVDKQLFLEELFFVPKQEHYLGMYCLSPAESHAVNSAICYKMLDSLRLTEPREK